MNEYSSLAAGTLGKRPLIRPATAGENARRGPLSPPGRKKAKFLGARRKFCPYSASLWPPSCFMSTGGLSCGIIAKVSVAYGYQRAGAMGGELSLGEIAQSGNGVCGSRAGGRMNLAGVASAVQCGCLAEIAD